jgi:hypothetical protein
MSLAAEHVFGIVVVVDGAPLEDEVVSSAGRMHAATAKFVDAATSMDASGDWSGIGMLTCAHWLTVATGVDLWNAREALRVGHALRDLPLIHAAFIEGSLSFDKVRALTHVATAEDEATWLDLAFQASGAQLSRICRQYRRSIAVDDPNRAALQRARRRLVSWWLEDDGMLALYATLPPEEGRLVLNAIESAVTRSSASVVADDPSADGEPDHPHGARRADALVRLCERWLHDAASARGSGRAPAPAVLTVHVDLDTLTGADDGGRCHIEDGPAVSLAAARRIGCDAEVVTVLERDGFPLDVGRARRVLSGRTRRLLQLRDGGCRYPGCGVPASDTEGHHVVHWVHGGRTDLANLVSLCRFHHHRHHEGAFAVVAETALPGGFRFETKHGRVIEVGRTSVPDANHGRATSPGRLVYKPGADATPVAAGGGAAFDLDHTITVLVGNLANVAARRSADQPSAP